MSVAQPKSLDQLLGQALAERSLEDDPAVEVTYELGDAFSYEKQHRLQPGEDPDTDGTGPPGSVELERRARRDALTLAAASVLCCNGLAALQSLQGSLFPGVGVQALCALYSLAALSCLGAPALVRATGPRWPCVWHAAASACYFAAFRFYDARAFVACCALLGSTLGPALCAFDARLSRDASRLPQVTRGTREAARRRLLRRYRVLAGTGAFWGNLAAWLVTGRSGVQSVQVAAAAPNGTQEVEISTSALYDFCFQFLEDSGGGGFRDASGNGVAIQFTSLRPESVSTLVLIFASSAVLGALLVLVEGGADFPVQQDPLERPLLLQTLRQMRTVLADGRTRLAAPLLLFIGIGQGFIVADFTRYYVSCSLGLESIVLTMTCMGGCNALGSAAVHLFSEHIQRTVIMAAGLVCQSGLLMVLYLWTPAKDDAPVFYVIAGGWGLCNAIWETLTITHVASTYAEDWPVPFAAHRLLQCLGTALCLAVGPHLDSRVKVCALAACLALSIVPYTVLEFRIHHRSSARDRTAVL